MKISKKINQNASGRGAIQKFLDKKGGIEYLNGLIDNLKSFDNVAEYLFEHQDFECAATSLRRYAKMNDGKVGYHGGDHCSREFRDSMIKGEVE